jgi:hypothetical protein
MFESNVFMPELAVKTISAIAAISHKKKLYLIAALSLSRDS